MVKSVNTGESIGYGRSFFAQRPTKIAIIPTGYADGYNRLLSNNGYVLIQGKKARILGKICMDQMMVDITDIREAGVGDIVTLVGTDGMETITADDIGRSINTIGLLVQYAYQLSPSRIGSI